MPTCIYCSTDKAPTEFNTEHVVPVAFGTFENNFTLNDCVCSDCNDYFGRTLDRTLSRDSAEALIRFHAGIKPVEEVKDLTGRRLVLELDVEGPWHGVRLELDSEDGELVIVPAAQAMFEAANEAGWVVMTERREPLPVRPRPRPPPGLPAG